MTDDGVGTEPEGRRGSQGRLAVGRLSGYSLTIAVRGSHEKEASEPTTTTQFWSGSKTRGGVHVDAASRAYDLPTEDDGLLKKLFVMRDTGAVT
jgi:hypothetical protein